MTLRHKAFISYHSADVNEVERFINEFDHQHDVFISRAVGTGIDPSIINSSNPEYVMSRIRDLYLKDSTVTIVLIGKCTWSRKYIDWEIQSSLRNGATAAPNGLVGIVLPSAKSNPIAPERLKTNLDSGYSNWYYYPKSKSGLIKMIEEAFEARQNKKNLIINPRDRFIKNRNCY
jgi:hypothetical protein